VSSGEDIWVSSKSDIWLSSAVGIWLPLGGDSWTPASFCVSLSEPHGAGSNQGYGLYGTGSQWYGTGSV